MNRTIKEAAADRCFYQTADELQKYPGLFIAACNFTGRLGQFRG